MDLSTQSVDLKDESVAEMVEHETRLSLKSHLSEPSVSVTISENVKRDVIQISAKIEGDTFGVEITPETLTNDALDLRTTFVSIISKQLADQVMKEYKRSPPLTTYLQQFAETIRLYDTPTQIAGRCPMCGETVSIEKDNYFPYNDYQMSNEFLLFYVVGLIDRHLKEECDQKL